MASSTATMRIPGYTGNDLTGLVSSLVPTPACHFLIAGYTPIATMLGGATAASSVRRTSIQDVLSDLLNPKNIMADFFRKEGCYLSLMDIIQSRPGAIDAGQIHNSLQRIHERRSAKFVPWGPAAIQVSLSNRSPYIPYSSKVSGMMLANHSSFRNYISRVSAQYKKL
eukprot:gnl/Chilomastix_caulleri/2760.p1 GENE.gnl/Chilomastix_caulleri/2760~~gnl/Chilomastix_caulleri/2760.p1  ORF type:complete len:168 (-),score=63.12 gnl/Chilomastix_caulleri/2760:218-721(-)